MITPLLSISDAGTFWPFLCWTEFQAWPHKEGTVVVVPLVGLADWGLGLPLDLEEVLLCSLMKEASARRGNVPLLVLPPLRFVVGPVPGCAFGVSPPVACALVSDTVLSIKASGFTRVVLLNSSPWNEELCDAAARDLRIEHGLQMFCIAMSGLGLDLHPSRGHGRAAAGALYSAITGIPAAPHSEGSAGDPGASLPEEAFEAAAGRLTSLLGEICQRRPLADGGRIGAATLP
jgi:creatinine amidohydrolase